MARCVRIVPFHGNVCFTRFMSVARGSCPTHVRKPEGLGPGVEVLYIEAGDLDHGGGRVGRVL